MIELYQKEECPYCKRVREVLNELNLDFICRISKSGTKQREVMLQLGGQAMVPFLVDQERGVMMYESEDIIAYLRATYGKGTSEHCCGQGCGHCQTKTESETPKVCPVE